MKAGYYFIPMMMALVTIPLHAERIAPNDLQALSSKIEQLEKRVRALEEQLAPSSPVFDIPCYEDSYDTDTDFKELAIAEASTKEDAKNKAIQQAVEMLAVKIYPEMISYKAVTTSSKYGEQSQSEIIVNITEKQKQHVHKNCDMTCCSFKRTPTGMYEAYVVLSISKSAIKK